MKQIKNLSILALLGLTLSLTALAQDATSDQNKIYKNIEVEQFTATEESKFPAENLPKLTESVYKNFQKTDRFEKIKLNDKTTSPQASTSVKRVTIKTSDKNETDDSENTVEELSSEYESKTEIGEQAEMSTDSNGATLRVSGEVVRYKKGNRAARYVIGFGAGATKIVADITFTDVETGEVVLKAIVDGDVWIGVFGGDSDDAKSGVADEIMKVLKKNKLVGNKMKK